MQLYKRLRREYEHGLGTISGVAQKYKVHRRTVRAALKNAVRLTFPKGAQVKDPKKIFNTRLDSKTVRAIDFREGDMVDEAALRGLILEAVGLNE